jgi:hypothetical protein
MNLSVARTVCRSQLDLSLVYTTRSGEYGVLSVVTLTLNISSPIIDLARQPVPEFLWKQLVLLILLFTIFGSYSIPGGSCEHANDEHEP